MDAGINKCYSKSIILFFFSVQLSEPTRYSDVFDYVVKHICSKESEDDYTIVLLVTDGGVTDFQETKEVLVRNSHMPISVVLVRQFFAAKLNEKNVNTNQLVTWRAGTTTLCRS